MSLCFDCANACGGCSWSELDPKTMRPRFVPVEGWDAIYIDRDFFRAGNGSYEVLSCPQFKPDPPRKPIELPTLKKKGATEEDQRLLLLAIEADKSEKRESKNKAEWQRAMRKRRIAAGLCSNCGKNPARPNRMTCEECARKDKERFQKMKVHHG